MLALRLQHRHFRILLDATIFGYRSHDGKLLSAPFHRTRVRAKRSRTRNVMKDLRFRCAVYPKIWFRLKKTSASARGRPRGHTRLGGAGPRGQASAYVRKWPISDDTKSTLDCGCAFSRHWSGSRLFAVSVKPIARDMIRDNLGLKRGNPLETSVTYNGLSLEWHVRLLFRRSVEEVLNLVAT